MADAIAYADARPESGDKESRVGQNWRAGNYQQAGGSVLMSRGGSILVSAEARVIVNNIYESRKRIKEFPTQGRVVPEIGQKDIREIFCGSYRIIYQIEAKRILILTIRHMKQKLIKA